MLEAGEETPVDTEQADNSWEDASHQDWGKKNGWEDKNGWRNKDERSRRGSRDHKEFNDEDVFMLEMEKQHALKIIGGQGRMVKEINRQSGAFIKIDPDVEPATVRVAGSINAVDRARAMIHDVLNSEWDKPDPGSWSDEMFRKCTKDESARIIGSRGSNIQYIEKKSWAKVEIGKEEHGGIVMVRINGDFDAVDKALQMISDVLNNTGDWSKDWGSDGGGSGGRKRKRFQDGEEPDVIEVLHFEASYSGSIVGRGGVEINKLREKSGAEIDIAKIENDQKCEVTMKGNAEEVELAKKLVNELVEQIRAKRAPREGALTETLEFEKKAVKHIIGPRGAHIKEVRERTGADIKVEDDYSKCTVTIHGTPEQIQIAKEMIEELAGSPSNSQRDDWKSKSWNDNSDKKDDWKSQSWNNNSDNTDSSQSNAWESGPSLDSMDAGAADLFMGLATAKGAPPKAPGLLPNAVMKAPGPLPNALLKAPGGWPSAVPPKFGGLDSLCDSLQSGDVDDAMEPPAEEVMGIALMKAPPPKGNVIPPKLGGVNKFLIMPNALGKGKVMPNAPGKGKGGKQGPTPQFSQPVDSDGWDNSEDWQDSNADGWQQEQAEVPTAFVPKATGPVKVAPRPVVPKLAFSQPATDDWANGSADNWQADDEQESNSGPGAVFTQPAADSWDAAPVKPVQQQLQQQPQTLQRPPLKKPALSWLQDEQPQTDEQLSGNVSLEQLAAQAQQQAQLSWLQPQEEQPSDQQQTVTDELPSWGGWTMF